MDDGVDRDGVGVNQVYSRKYFNETPSELQGLKVGKNKLIMNEKKKTVYYLILS